MKIHKAHHSGQSIETYDKGRGSSEEPSRVKGHMVKQFMYTETLQALETQRPAHESYFHNFFFVPTQYPGAVGIALCAKHLPPPSLFGVLFTIFEKNLLFALPNF